ncbi:L-fuculose-phosphate aldolase [Methanosarcina thermophila]|jgi:L-fuculose-phosphate aldolase|uniref:Ribulose-5-phosphate 4-epimerase and related epimerase and aldolase n=5 Tax=Methanosarcina thermophila TaxID=2210 RepID=A0A0E3KRA1_METTE|nr:Ribulose-5-phosphate 4-epimerase and related epimerase and aldolase [Methanosarcina thermophila TM-1]AKB15575.1 Ribulose-5-phosphate 4-epimerase and related epimerase and aldolase [Methanosarcina thermophila CHTI-55]SFT80089.1 L-fuculose-phosphate aldolase [Methanosarcina thermophila]
MADFPFRKPSVMFKLSCFLLFAGLQKNKYINLMAVLVYIPLKMWQEIAKYGRKLVEHGLVESNFGNISIRAGNRMLITRTGAALDEITENGVVEVDIQDTSSLDIIASSEAVVHREIYRQTSALAIIHAHSAYSVVESLLAGPEGKIMPVDSEGLYFLGEIPVVGGGIGSRELAENLANALSRYRGAIVYSHGTFAIGRTLGDAYVITTQLEHSCKVKYLYDRAAAEKNKHTKRTLV